MRGRKSSPFSPEFPISRRHLLPGPLSVLLSSSMPTALKLESATAKKNPSLQLRLSLLGFLFQGAGAQVWVKEMSTAAAAWEDLLFLIPAPQQELTPAKPGLLESFVSYLMTQLLTHIAQQSCQAMEAAQMPWDKIQSLHLHLPFPLWWSYVSIQLSAEQICNIIVSKQRGCLYSKQCKQCRSLQGELWEQ